MHLIMLSLKAIIQQLIDRWYNVVVKHTEYGNKLPWVQVPISPIY